MGDVVWTPDGKGKVVESETRHGRTWINVAGNGFQGWYLSHEVTAEIGETNTVNLDELPDKDDGARLPWDPEPRDLFHDQLNIQPTADLPPNLTESDSIQGLRNTDPMEPFPGGRMSSVRVAMLPWKQDDGGFYATTPDGDTVMIHHENGAWHLSGNSPVIQKSNEQGYTSAQEAMDACDQLLGIPGRHDIGDFSDGSSSAHKQTSRHPFGKEVRARHFAAEADHYEDFLAIDGDAEDDRKAMDKVVPHGDDDPYKQVDSESAPPGLSDYGDNYEEKNAVEFGGDPFPKKSNFFSDVFGGDPFSEDEWQNAGPHPQQHDAPPRPHGPGKNDPDDPIWGDHAYGDHNKQKSSMVDYEVVPSRDGFFVTASTGDVLDGPYADQADAEHTARFAAYEQFLDSDPMAREAAWADVRQKALRLRRDGQVKVTYYEPKEIQGEIQGDNGYYDAAVSRKNAFGNGVTYYSCSCPWGKWAYRRQMTYIGRFCSHGLALYHEMQALDNKGNRTINDAMNPFMNPAGSTDLGNFTGWGHHSKVAGAAETAEDIIDRSPPTRKEMIRNLNDDDLGQVSNYLDSLNPMGNSDDRPNRWRDQSDTSWDVDNELRRRRSSSYHFATDVDSDGEDYLTDADMMTPPGAQALPQNPSHAVEPDGQMEVFSDGDPLEGHEVPHVRDDGGDGDLMGDEVPHDPLAGSGSPTETDDLGMADSDTQQAQLQHDMAAMHGSDTGAAGDTDIARAAAQFLSKTAAKQYSLAEQEELMHEAGNASQLGNLNLTDSLYEEGPHVIFLP